MDCQEKMESTIVCTELAVLTRDDEDLPAANLFTSIAHAKSRSQNPSNGCWRLHPRMRLLWLLAVVALSCAICSRSQATPNLSNEQARQSSTGSNDHNGAVSQPIAQGSTVSKVDYAPYMESLERRIKRNWFPPTSNRSRAIGVVFKVDKYGTLSALRLSRKSGDDALDQSGLNAVRHAAPFKPLPVGSDPVVDVQFTFQYNNLVGGTKDKNSDEMAIKKELDVARKSDSSGPGTLRALLKLACYYDTRGLNKKAWPLYQNAVELLQKHPDIDGESLSDVLLSLGKSFSEGANRAQAVYTLDKALEVALRRYGESAQYLSILIQAARLSSTLEDRAHTEKYIESAAQLVRDPSIVAALSGTTTLPNVIGDLGDVEVSLQNYLTAISFYKAAIQSEAQISGKESIQVASRIVKLGDCLCLNAQYKEAKQCYAEALRINRSQQGQSSIEVAQGLHDLAHCDQQLGNLDAARALFTEALALNEKLYGKQSEAVAAANDDLADCLECSNAFEDAQKRRKKALAIKVSLADTSAIEEEQEAIRKNKRMQAITSGRVSESSTSQKPPAHGSLVTEDPGSSNSTSGATWVASAWLAPLVLAIIGIILGASYMVDRSSKANRKPE